MRKNLISILSTFETNPKLRNPDRLIVRGEPSASFYSEKVPFHAGFKVTIYLKTLKWVSLNTLEQRKEGDVRGKRQAETQQEEESI